jgi:hypothetical protein
MCFNQLSNLIAPLISWAFAYAARYTSVIANRVSHLTPHNHSQSVPSSSTNACYSSLFVHNPIPRSMFVLWGVDAIRSHSQSVHSSPPDACCTSLLVHNPMFVFWGGVMPSDHTHSVYTPVQLARAVKGGGGEAGGEGGGGG